MCESGAAGSVRGEDWQHTWKHSQPASAADLGAQRVRVACHGGWQGGARPQQERERDGRRKEEEEEGGTDGEDKQAKMESDGESREEGGRKGGKRSVLHFEQIYKIASLIPSLEVSVLGTC